ncbi:hypothetical protein BDW67DRAFT_188827 [Aspergillus spinulosporus]
METFKKLQQKQPIAWMSIICRGKSISQSGVFGYTNSHFLIKEGHHFARRYQRFNLDALCDIAATAGGSTSRITAIEKLEGRF